VQGYVITSAAIGRGICYCKDCQSFAHFLGREKHILNDLGGTDIVPAAPRGVVFTQGKESLACMQLSPKGLLRWYAKCCNTPVGNTWRHNKLSYVGLIHSCLESGGQSIDESFGPVRMQVNVQSAKGVVHEKSKGLFSGLFRWTTMMFRERISGTYKRSPFFVPSTGQPIAIPIVLTMDEKQALRNKL